MKNILVDTDVMIEFLRGNAKAVNFITSHFEQIMLSSVTVAELYSGVRDGKEREALDAFIARIHVVPISAKVAMQGGLYKRDYFKSHGTGLADAMIAATADSSGEPLFTFNRKHFPMLKNVKAPYKR